MISRIFNFFDWFASHVWSLISGIVFATLAYFSDISGAIHVMWIAFILDFFIGFITARVTLHERFNMMKAFIFLERLFIATAVVMILYACDKEMGQVLIHLHYVMTWLITGILSYSILDNGDQLTGGKFFSAIKNLLMKKINEQTGVDITESHHGKH